MTFPSDSDRAASITLTGAASSDGSFCEGMTRLPLLSAFWTSSCGGGEMTTELWIEALRSSG